MKLVDAILSNLAERRRLKREGRFTELAKQELDARKRHAELGIDRGSRNSEELARTMSSPDPHHDQSDSSSRMFMFGKALPPNHLRPRLDINDPHATVSGSVDSHKLAPGKQPFTASFIEQEVDVEIFVRKRSLGGKTYRLRRKRGPRNYRHVQIKPKTYMRLTSGKHRGQPLSNIGGTRRYGIYGSREDILSGNVKIVERYQGDSQRSLNEIIPEHIQKINASLTGHCRQLAESALATMSPEERQLSVDRFRDAIMAERPGWARKRVARNNQFLGKPVIRPALGSRVRWLDAYGNVSTLAGTVNHIRTGVPGEHATVETVYTVRKDDGDELETHAGNLIIIEDEL